MYVYILYYVIILHTSDFIVIIINWFVVITIIENIQAQTQKQDKCTLINLEEKELKNKNINI